MKIAKRHSPGATVPDWYGVYGYDILRNEYKIALIPINIIFALMEFAHVIIFYKIWKFICMNNGDAYRQGFQAGREDVETIFTAYCSNCKTDHGR